MHAKAAVEDAQRHVAAALEEGGRELRKARAQFSSLRDEESDSGWWGWILVVILGVMILNQGSIRVSWITVGLIIGIFYAFRSRSETRRHKRGVLASAGE